MALKFAESLQPHAVHAVLLARSEEGLKRTELDLEALSCKNLSVTLCPVDLSQLDSLESAVNPLLRQLREMRSSLRQAILVNCAGSTGFIGTHPSLDEVQQACNLNFTSKVWLSSRFADVLSGEPPTLCTIVNVSSMCAVKPTPTMGLYCATSAARDMFHSVLARDLQSRQCRILNYAPGSCDTQMQQFLREHDRLDRTVQAYCNHLSETDSLVNCKDTAAKLAQCVLQDPPAFSTGERLEYSDISSYDY